MMMLMMTVGEDGNDECDDYDDNDFDDDDYDDDDSDDDDNEGDVEGGRILVMAGGRIEEYAPPGVLLADRTSAFFTMARDAGLV